MFKETIDYVDFDGNPRTRVAYFNISKSELIELEASEKGGYSTMIQNIVEEKDPQKLLESFKKILRLSYGIKSPDGDRFIKSDEIWEEFSQTGAYEELYMRLATDSDYSANFIKGIIPNVEEIIARIAAGNNANIELVR